VPPAGFDRHGTTTLFAALEVATGKLTDACTERHCHLEFLGRCELVEGRDGRVLLPGE
jgi:hypothetical protein